MLSYLSDYNEYFGPLRLLKYMTLRTIFAKTGWSSPEVKAMRGVIRALVGPARQRD